MLSKFILDSLKDFGDGFIDVVGTLIIRHFEESLGVGFHFIELTKLCSDDHNFHDGFEAELLLISVFLHHYDSRLELLKSILWVVLHLTIGLIEVVLNFSICVYILIRFTLTPIISRSLRTPVLLFI